MLLLGTLLACGCSAAPQDAASAQAAQDVWLGDVRDGATSTHDITAKLGEPTETYVGGRIFVYRLVCDANPVPIFAENRRRLFFQGIV
ncbi:MAG TPA: hypothetical protein VFC46_10240, partial [Humisphaera sp.]|nr:hypothetical protein [Humisphaera sp.]